jgi:hypothetical protein
MWAGTETMQVTGTEAMPDSIVIPSAKRSFKIRAILLTRHVIEIDNDVTIHSQAPVAQVHRTGEPAYST